MPHSWYLNVQSLTCRYGEVALFTDLDFTVKPGTLLQIVGRNGAGKSSLLKILAGILPPASGQAMWRHDHQKTEDNQVQMVYMGHEAMLVHGLTVGEALRRLPALLGRPLHDSIEAILTAAGLRAYRDWPVEVLSAGQKKRLTLTTLLTTLADAWLLDEPFTALDPWHSASIQQSMQAYLQQGGLIVCTSHRAEPILSEARLLNLDRAAHVA